MGRIAVLFTFFAGHLAFHMALYHERQTSLVALFESMWNGLTTSVGRFPAKSAIAQLSFQIRSMWIDLSSWVGPSPVKNSMARFGFQTPQQQGALVGFFVRHLWHDIEVCRPVCFRPSCWRLTWLQLLGYGRIYNLTIVAAMLAALLYCI